MDAKQVERLKKLEAVKDAADRTIAKEKAAVELQKNTRREIGRTKEALEGVKAVLGGEVARKMIRGEGLDGSDFARLAIASERAGVKIAEKIFGESKALKAVKGAFAAAPIFGEAVSAISTALNEVEKEKKEAQGFGRRFGSGQLSNAEFNLFQKLNGRFAFFGNPKDSVEQTASAADAITAMPKEKLQQILTKVAGDKFGPFKANGVAIDVGPDFSDGGKAFFEGKNRELGVDADKLFKAIEQSSSNRRNFLKRALRPEEQAQAVREAVVDTLGHLPNDVREAISKSILESAESQKQSKAAISKSAAVDFNERIAELQSKWRAEHASHFSVELNGNPPNTRGSVGATTPTRRSMIMEFIKQEQIRIATEVMPENKYGYTDD